MLSKCQLSIFRKKPIAGQFRMQLSKEAIEEYKKIYKEVEGKEISDEEAREKETGLINLFKVLLKADKK